MTKLVITGEQRLREVDILCSQTGHRVLKQCSSMLDLVPAPDRAEKDHGCPACRRHAQDAALDAAFDVTASPDPIKSDAVFRGILLEPGGKSPPCSWLQQGENRLLPLFDTDHFRLENTAGHRSGLCFLRGS